MLFPFVILKFSLRLQYLIRLPNILLSKWLVEQIAPWRATVFVGGMGE
jgi:hypothetical protein